MPIHCVLAGPTASGKTALAVRWALARGFEVISADSRQLYRGFKIGTGTPPENALQGVPHHLLSCLDPNESYSPRRFRAEAEALVTSRPETNFLVVGGTGLYLKEWMYPGSEERGETPRAIREAAAAEIAERGLETVHADLTTKDPAGMQRVDPNDAYRITKRLENWLHTGRSYATPKPEEPLNPLFRDVPFLWLETERKELHRRIKARAEAMFRDGWAAEVKDLMQPPHGYDPLRTPAFNAIGYREIADALARGKDPASVLETVVARTRQYAKKQMTFFRHQFPRAQAWEPDKLATALEDVDWDAHRLPQPAPPSSPAPSLPSTPWP